MGHQISKIGMKVKILMGDVILLVLLAAASGFTNNIVYQPVGNIIDVSYQRETVRPVENSNTTLVVYADWNLVSIIDFDEINGFIEVGGFLTLTWIASAYDNITVNDTENFLNTAIWKPPILLVNSVEYYSEVGSDSRIRISYNFSSKECMWKPWIITKVACSPNVQYYPFDKQSCKLKFAVWGYRNEAVKLMPKQNQWTFDFFEENGEWSIDETSVSSSTVNEVSAVEFTIAISRRPLYHIINLIAPVLLLGVLDSFTFLLPIGSGERVGFAVTCFLAYVVFLNTIMAFLPTSSNPFSYLSYYTFVMMLFSAGVSLLTVLTVRLHHDEKGKVPDVLSCLFRCFHCRCRSQCNCSSRGKKNRITVVRAVDDDNSISETGSENKESDIITWPAVAAFLDKLLFFAFLGGQMFFTVAYIVPLFFYSQ